MVTVAAGLYRFIFPLFIAQGFSAGGNILKETVLDVWWRRPLGPCVLGATIVWLALAVAGAVYGVNVFSLTAGGEGSPVIILMSAVVLYVVYQLLRRAPDAFRLWVDEATFCLSVMVFVAFLAGFSISVLFSGLLAAQYAIDPFLSGVWESIPYVTIFNLGILGAVAVVGYRCVRSVDNNSAVAKITTSQARAAWGSVVAIQVCIMALLYIPELEGLWGEREILEFFYGAGWFLLLSNVFALVPHVLLLFSGGVQNGLLDKVAQPAKFRVTHGVLVSLWFVATTALLVVLVTSYVSFIEWCLLLLFLALLPRPQWSGIPRSIH